MPRPPSTVPPASLPFPRTESVPDFPALEREVLDYWQDEGIFEETLDPGRADEHPLDGSLQEAVVVDLPAVTRRLPSPTDLLTGYLHDTWCRYRTMGGWVVPRSWIQLPHGIPTELEAMRRLELPDRQAVEAHGVDAFVTGCHAVAGETDLAWMQILRRQGRWLAIDEAFDSALPDPIGSVWWAFRTLHEKGLVYEGTARAPWSETLGTPLADLEVRLAGDGSLRSPYGGEATPEREVSGWFLKVTALKDQIRARIQQAQWFPAELRQEILAWLDQAGDWCLSRERWWGTPVPVWQNATETQVLGSLAELDEILGEVPSDCHRGSLDQVEIPSPSGGAPLRRVPQVLDAWFDAACLPFARFCYPAAVEEHFRARFPIDLAVQSRNQARGWWYALVVLSTALFDEPAVLNGVSHAEVRCTDGEELGELDTEAALALFDAHGSDPLRWSLAQGSAERSLCLPAHPDSTGLQVLWGHLDAFCRAANDAGDPITEADWPETPEHAADRALLTKLHDRVLALIAAADGLRLAECYGVFLGGFQDVTDWRAETLARVNAGSSPARGHRVTFHRVLVTLARCLAPFAPLIAELVYLSLTQGRSVHLERWPDPTKIPTFRYDKEHMDREEAAT